MKEPQFTLEKLYISPFKAKRKYDEDGNIMWIPMEQNFEPSGIWVMDRYLQFLMSGGFLRSKFCEQEGISTNQLSGMIFVLTGMSAMEFQQRYVLMIADQLLRYTSLSLDQIARHYGGIDATNLCRICQRIYHTTPGHRREILRKPKDEGRYRI